MKRMLLVLLLLIPVAHAISWSEIMFDPAGSDDGKEFIELIGNENLTDCTVADSKSSDTLELLQQGNNVILIVETDGLLNNTPDATIYGAGKAIGNGLGNSYEELTISCDNTLLQTSYNVSTMNFTPGMSIHYKNGMWVPGNSSPGIIEKETVATTEECNNSLVITMSAVETNVNESVQFTIVTDAYASYEAYADGKVFTYGDTLTQKTHHLIVPEAKEIKIVAQAQQCKARQRAVRIITVHPRPVGNETRVNITTNVSTTKTVPVVHQVPKNLTPVIKKETIVNEDANVVPWVSSFGIVTLLVGAWTYKQTVKDEEK